MSTTRHTAYKFRVGDIAYTYFGDKLIVIGRFRYPKLFPFNIYTVINFEHSERPVTSTLKNYHEGSLYVKP